MHTERRIEGHGVSGGEGPAIGRDEVVEALADAPVAVGVGVEVSDVVGTEEREPVDEVEVGSLPSPTIGAR